MTEPSPFQLLRASWDASTARADALTKGQPWTPKDTSLLGVFAGWAVTVLPSTKVCDLMEWSPQELRALLSTELLGGRSAPVTVVQPARPVPPKWTPETLTCPGCGERFVTGRWGQKACSPECRAVANRRPKSSATEQQRRWNGSDVR